MEIRIHISDICESCGGMCRVPVGMDIDANDQPYMRHKPCPACEGGGRTGRWISIEECNQVNHGSDTLWFTSGQGTR